MPTPTTSPATAQFSDATDCRVVKGDLETGGLSIRALPTPGHKDDHLAFVVNDELCCSGDVLFKDAVGGGDLEQIRRSVMDVLMQLPPETRVLPGHTDETTIGREWEENPFVRVWRGAEPGGHRSPYGSAARRRRSSSGRPTTTARARRGSASTTAGTPSSAAHAWNAARRSASDASSRRESRPSRPNGSSTIRPSFVPPGYRRPCPRRGRSGPDCGFLTWKIRLR